MRHALRIALVLLAAAPPGAALAQSTGRTPPAPPAPTDQLLPTSDAVRTVAGQWDLAVPMNNLKCRIQLNVAGNPVQATVGMPTACRRSMGAIGRSEFWALSTGGAVRMLGPRNELLAEFSRADAGVLKAQVGANEFTMEPMGGRYPSPERLAGVDAAMQRLNAPQAENPSTPSAIAGRYKLLRAGGALRPARRPAASCCWIAASPVPCRRAGAPPSSAAARTRASPHSIQPAGSSSGTACSSTPARATASASTSSGTAS
jgi:hypothetical protein